MLCAVSPARVNFSEAKQSLQFAANCRNVALSADRPTDKTAKARVREESAEGARNSRSGSRIRSTSSSRVAPVRGLEMGLDEGVDDWPGEEQEQDSALWGGEQWEHGDELSVVGDGDEASSCAGDGDDDDDDLSVASVESSASTSNRALQGSSLAATFNRMAPLGAKPFAPYAAKAPLGAKPFGAKAVAGAKPFGAKPAGLSSGATGAPPPPIVKSAPRRHSLSTPSAAVAFGASKSSAGAAASREAPRDPRRASFPAESGKR